MAMASSHLAPPSASLPAPRSLHLVRPQLPFPSSSRWPRKTGAADPPEVASLRWRAGVSFFPSFLKKKARSPEEIKEELLEAIAPLDRGADATPDDQERIDQIARELEAVNTVKEPFKSDLINGKWELIYTTSRSILQVQRPKFLRPNGEIYQAINADTLRAQNMETWPYFNQVTANLVPLNAKRVNVQFDTFKIFGLIPIKAPGRGRGELEITYLDEEIRISRGDKGNLFILKMVDPSYRVPVRG
ncbi:probable plastid-lipid-associated protein 4, chloroplastic [Musa acuminata AAA Group]|uniref:probable plastid-lipid-associated protein 4, chloroplastic n=1 Tax=Musa acuminata AAA Group TaxID=214697 RepID=UPI0031D069D7